MSNDSWLKRLTTGLGTLTDAMVYAISPRAGNDRAAQRRAREIKDQFHRRKLLRLSADAEDRDSLGGGGGFASAENSRNAHSWLISKLSPQAALELDLETMRDRANSAYKNYPLFAGHIERRVQRVAGVGIMLAPQIKADPGKITEDQAKEWNRALRQAFERWCRKAGGRLQFHVIQRQVIRHVEKDGIAFVQIGDAKQTDPRIPTTLRLKVIHPRRVATPPQYTTDANVRAGIRISDDGDLLGYYVRQSIPGDNKKFRQRFDFVPAFTANGLARMVHIGEPREAEQVIGYPTGQVSLSRLKNSEEYEEAELERNIVASCFTAFVHGSGDPGDLAAAAATTTDSRGNRIQELAPGRVEYLGSDAVTFATPPGPQATFAPYVEHQGRMAAAGCGTSYEMMSGIWTGVSYSGGKLIWIDEQGPIDCLQADLIEMLLIPVWQNFVNRCILTNIIEVSQGNYKLQPWLYEAVKFVPPKRHSIDPARERRAAHMDIAAGIIVHSDEVEQMNGRPAEDVYEDIHRNYLERSALEGVPVEIPIQGGTQLGDTNESTAAGGDGRAKQEQVGTNAQLQPKVDVTINTQQPIVNTTVNVPEPKQAEIKVENPVTVNVPQQAAPQVSVTVPEQQPVINNTINVPEQEPPQVIVEAPQVSVNMPEPQPFHIEPVRDPATGRAMMFKRVPAAK